MEQTMQQKLAELRKPLSAKDISWRVGRVREDGTKGQALPYIKPRVIQDLLDDVIGPENWRNSFVPNPMAGNPSLISVIEILVNGQWVAKSDGAQLDDVTPESNNKEIAIKGMYSDAFKRAAVMWGIGRYLYAFEAPWVELTNTKGLASIPKLPAHMLPEAERANAASTAKTSTAKPAEKADATPAPAPAAEAAPAVQAASAPEPKATPAAPAARPADDDSEARSRAAAAVDAAMDSTASTQEQAASARAAAPAPAPAAASSATDGMPEGLTEEQQKTVNGLIEKIKKPLPTVMLRNYVNGPKAAEALPEHARAYILRLLDEADAAKANQA
jgi:hypothetical protein